MEVVKGAEATSFGQVNHGPKKGSGNATLVSLAPTAIVPISGRLFVLSEAKNKHRRYQCENNGKLAEGFVWL